MENLTIPPTIYIAFGVVTAALLTGFFSFLNMVSAKENKVSEFRLAWVDGLREEIADYTSAVQELVRIEVRRFNTDQQPYEVAYKSTQAWLKLSKDAFDKAIGNMTKIQLRLNPNHIKEKPDSPEAILMVHINKAREEFNNGDYQAAFNCCIDIRSAAAPLLKTTWDLVKTGELEYQKIRKNAQRIVIGGTALTIVLAITLGGFSFFHSLSNSLNSKPHESFDANGIPIKEIPTTNVKAPEISLEERKVPPLKTDN
ncbi:hypothetical protein [Pseudomonas sp. PB106]|uniref:hypothetical protein n=1 Tax=Pseudomonas sp. PB106 TaxID=2494699 RepID=UPI00131B6A21|nr:hypothetical protein [Pseudomonas sp. PB106]KAE9642967.1 hypothetical protein EJA71_17805 [Pseudomonas sp. PB106]